MAISQGHRAITDVDGITFGNGLAVDGGDGQGVTIQVGVVAQHIDVDAAVFVYAEAVCQCHGDGVGSLERFSRRWRLFLYKR